MSIPGDCVIETTEESMADDLSVTREGDTLVIVVASTRGNQKTAIQIDGKDLYLGVNAYVYAEPKASTR